MKKKLKKCSDEKINFIMNNSTEAENKVLIKGDNLRIVISQIESTVITNCENVKRIIESDLNNEVEKVIEKTNNNPFPTNFAEKDLSKASKNIENFNGKIVAFDSKVTKVKSGYKDKPYYKVELENGGQIWVASLITSGYEIIGKKLRILGFFSDVKNDEIAKKYNKSGFHILAFAIIDLETKQMSMLPGTDKQIKEWMNGKIPTDK